MTHFLSILMVLPLVGALVIAFTPRQWLRSIRMLSIGVMLVEMLLSLMLLDWRVSETFDPLGAARAGFGLPDPNYASPAYYLVESVEWVPTLGIGWRLGIDGLSLWLVVLTTFMTPVALWVSWGSVSTKIKEFAIAFLLLEVGMIGAFVALDLFLFYVFWELMLVPMYLIIGIWGGKDRVYAAVKFFLYTMVGSLLMLVAILFVVARYHQLALAAGLPADQQWSFALADLTRVVLPFEEQVFLFAAFALAFAIKVPMFPVHTWLPDAHVQAPTGGSVILAAVLLKLGGYGFLRFAIPLFPFAAHWIGPTLAVFAVVGIIYGAACAWVQRDVKKLVAYSSVSHLGFVMLGVLSMTTGGVSGAVLQMIAHGISTGALFILVGVIYDRRHTRDLEDFGGLAKVMPSYAIAFIIVTMSSVGLPGTNGFIGEFMILSGSWVSVNLSVWQYIFTLFAATGVILAAVYMLHATLKMFWGPTDNEANRGLPDLNGRELTALVPLIVIIFGMGLFPETMLRSIKPSVENLISNYDARWQSDYRNDGARLLPAPRADAALEGEGAEANTGSPLGADALAARGAR